MKKDATSLRRFAWLLKQRGCDFWPEDRLHEKITVQGKTPDFYVETPSGQRFIAEVKSFEAMLEDSPLRTRTDGARVEWINPDRYEGCFARVRGSVKEAAKQLRPYQSLAIPMIVILDNWRKVGIATGQTEIISVFGTLEGRVRFNFRTGASGPSRWHHGGGQVLTNKNGRYISAIAWNFPQVRQENDSFLVETHMRVRMVHNPFASVSFPVDVFNSPRDEHWVLEDGSWRRHAHIC